MPDLPKVESDGYVGLHVEPRTGKALFWPYTCRFEPYQVALFIGRLYRRNGETIEQGWDRAVGRGWSVAHIKMWGHIN